MIGLTKPAQPLLLQCLETQFEKLLKTESLYSLRLLGWKKFHGLGLPRRTQDAFKYISLGDLHTFTMNQSLDAPIVDKNYFESEIFPESKHSYLLFVNGSFAPELSDISALPSQIRILPLSEAVQSHRVFLQQHLQQQIQAEQDPFAALNLALHSNGLFIYIPPKVIVDMPIQCLQITTGSFAAPRIQVTAGAHTQTKWIFSCLGCKNNAILNLPLIDFTLEEEARVHICSMEPNQAYQQQFSSLRSVLKKQASLDVIHVSGGSKTSRLHAHVCLKGKESKTQLKGIWNLFQQSSSHYHLTVEHKGLNTSSLQHFKGVLRDSSRSSFEGKIRVDSEAQGTRAYQLNNNLLLGPRAIANSKPNLEIFADDVKASHGATVSQLNEEELFYLYTRGLSPNQATQILLNAYLQEIIQEIPYPYLIERISRDIL